MGCSTCAECAAGRVSTCLSKTGSWQSNCYGLGHALQGRQAQYLLVSQANSNLVRIPTRSATRPPSCSRTTLRPPGTAVVVHGSRRGTRCW
ncbi:hypothetical protein L1080_027820 [Rhodococcus sp. MSC1_016]|uniref:hypothetical protein n=1 Tax=Rhodococcus sp. MSC1_016 TaxID=2909266 RepID=UPI0035B24318